jgi:hypothetical protein
MKFIKVVGTKLLKELYGAGQPKITVEWLKF